MLGQLGPLGGMAKGYPEQVFMVPSILSVLLHLCLHVCLSIPVCLHSWDSTGELLKECDPCTHFLVPLESPPSQDIFGVHALTTAVVLTELDSVK